MAKSWRGAGRTVSEFAENSFRPQWRSLIFGTFGRNSGTHLFKDFFNAFSAHRTIQGLKYCVLKCVHSGLYRNFRLLHFFFLEMELLLALPLPSGFMRGTFSLSSVTSGRGILIRILGLGCERATAGMKSKSDSMVGLHYQRRKSFSLRSRLCVAVPGIAAQDQDHPCRLLWSPVAKLSREFEHSSLLSGIDWRIQQISWKVGHGFVQACLEAWFKFLQVQKALCVLIAGSCVVDPSSTPVLDMTHWVALYNVDKAFLSELLNCQLGPPPRFIEIRKTFGPPPWLAVWIFKFGTTPLNMSLLNFTIHPQSLISRSWARRKWGLVFSIPEADSEHWAVKLDWLFCNFAQRGSLVRRIS